MPQRHPKFVLRGAVRRPVSVRRQPGHDHHRHIGAAQQRRHRQQHVGHAAAGAPRPARTQPHRPVRASKLPRPGPPPTRQHTTTRRATQLTRCQPALDLIDIRLYGDHCASKRNRRPSRKTPPETCREGRRLQRRDHHAAPTPQAPTQLRSVGELLTVNAGSQPPDAQPECLRTHCEHPHSRCARSDATQTPLPEM